MALSNVGRSTRWLILLALGPLVCACVTLTVEPRVLRLQDDGSVLVQSLACSGPSFVVPTEKQADASQALDPQAIRVISWNIHKQGDAGWQRDLLRFVIGNDIVLLQEIVLQDSLREIIERAGLRWVMGSSFLYLDDDMGVLTAARVAPVASCTQRAVEPLIRLPKSAVITWFRLAGRTQTLAVVNVHAINFSLSLGAYRAQITALGETLASHRGPIIFAGDLNTWTDARTEAVREVAAKLGLTELSFAEDRRKLFFGKQLDHIYVRGLESIASSAIPVTSSDHNPVDATLRVMRDTH